MKTAPLETSMESEPVPLWKAKLSPNFKPSLFRFHVCLRVSGAKISSSWGHVTMKLCLFGVVGLAFEIQFAGELTGNGNVPKRKHQTNSSEMLRVSFCVRSYPPYPTYPKINGLKQARHVVPSTPTKTGIEQIWNLDARMSGLWSSCSRLLRRWWVWNPFWKRQARQYWRCSSLDSSHHKRGWGGALALPNAPGHLWTRVRFIHLKGKFKPEPVNRSVQLVRDQKRWPSKKQVEI